MLSKKCHNILVALCLVIAGCSENPGSTEEPDPTGSIPGTTESDVTIDMRAEKISQLVGDYDEARDEATQNQTNSRYQLRATDLGVPFQDGDRTYIVFGDTWGEVGGDRDAMAYTTDNNPDDGLSLNFVADDNGTYSPITISEISQGAFEVPVEGLMADDQMYIYHTTGHDPPVTMGRSVLARSSGDDERVFEYLYDFSHRYFINVSIVKVSSADWEFLPESEGEGLVILGSGRYRESNVYLAYQPVSEIENPDAVQYFAGVDENDTPLWVAEERNALPIFELDIPCVGELSTSYNTFIDRWILLYNCSDPRGINMRTAENPWGPWTESQILYHPWDDGGYCNYIHASWETQQCDSVHDAGRENEWGGEYGPYQFEHFATGGGGSTSIYFTMSTWNPYTVVLMKAKLQI